MLTTASSLVRKVAKITFQDLNWDCHFYFSSRVFKIKIVSGLFSGNIRKILFISGDICPCLRSSLYQTSELFLFRTVCPWFSYMNILTKHLMSHLFMLQILSRPLLIYQAALHIYSIWIRKLKQQYLNQSNGRMSTASSQLVFFTVSPSTGCKQNLKPVKARVPSNRKVFCLRLPSVGSHGNTFIYVFNQNCVDGTRSVIVITSHSKFRN